MPQDLTSINPKLQRPDVLADCPACGKNAFLVSITDGGHFHDASGIVYTYGGAAGSGAGTRPHRPHGRQAVRRTGLALPCMGPRKPPGKDAAEAELKAGCGNEAAGTNAGRPNLKPPTRRASSAADKEVK